jgi:hypothetical protein
MTSNRNDHEVMKTATAPGAEELRDQLAQHEQEIEAAEVAIGEAALDGTNVTTATKRLAKARQDTEQTKAAIAELERRQRVADDREREAAMSAERLRSYQWAAEFLARAEAVLEAHARARDAEDGLYALGQNRKVFNATSGFRGTPEESDLDADLLASIPDLPSRPRGRWEPIRFGEYFTIERLREARALAQTRAEEEASGKGIDWSGQPGARMRERLAKRKGDLAA